MNPRRTTRRSGPGVRPPAWARRTPRRPAGAGEAVGCGGPYALCKRYAAGRLGRHTLIRILARWPYTPTPTTDGVDDVIEYPPGTWQDILDALHHGLIDRDTYRAVIRRR